MNDQADQLIPQQIEQTLEALQSAVGPGLLGLYLYGSAAHGGLRHDSDIDLLAVAARPSSPEAKARLARALMGISGRYRVGPRRCVELTVVAQAAVNPWRYPPEVDFQYGEWLREGFEQGSAAPWGESAMPDLAFLLAQALLASRTLYGPPPAGLLAPVPFADITRAATHELDRLLADLDSDTRNVLLTLARMWTTLETGAIRSKGDAAAWAMGRLPGEYRPVLRKARDEYLGAERTPWSDLRPLLEPCAATMAAAIRAQARRLEEGTSPAPTLHLEG